MKVKVFAAKKRQGQEISRKEIGIALVGEDHVISARKYNELKRALFNAYANVDKRDSLVLIMEDGYVDTFGGYPAEGNVKFEMVGEKKTTWGGKREGAGRKKSVVPKIVWTVKVTEEERDYLKGVLKEYRANQPAEPKRITYSEMFWKFAKATRTGESMQGVIVYSEDSFDQPYPLEARSYKVSSTCSAFDTDKAGGCIIGDSLDGTDKRVRLDQYDWNIEYCYIIE